MIRFVALTLALSLAGCGAARDVLTIGKAALGCAAQPNNCN